MARRRTFEVVDVDDLEFPSKEFAPFAKFLMRALRNVGYDYRKPDASRTQRQYIKDFALRHGLLYQTLWVAATGQAVPKDDFVTAVGKSLGLGKEGVFVLLLLAHQAKTPDPYRRLYDPIIREQAERAGVVALLG